MVQGLNGGAAGERMPVPFLGREEVGRVGFDEDAVRGERAEKLALGGFARVHEVEREGEMRAAFEQKGREAGRAGPGMEEEAAGGSGVFAERLAERLVGAEAVDGDGEVALAGDFQLPDEDAVLVGEVVAFDPAIESRLAQGGVRMAVEECG